MSLTGRPPASTAWTADLARIVPALAQETAGTGPATRPGADPQLERVQLCEAVVQFLAWASRQAPLLLAFEDLHLSDLASLELIAYTGRRLSRLPVLLVLTRRKLPSRQDLDAVLGALRSRGALVGRDRRWRPLTDAAARALVEATADLPAATVAQIVTMAAGAPCSRSRPPARAARDDAEPHRRPRRGGPAGHRPAIGPGARVRRVRRGGRAATSTAARSPRSRCAVPPCAAAEALGSGLLRADGGPIGFRHALLRDAVYQEIPDPIRARLHGELAQLLRKRGRPPDPVHGGPRRLAVVRARPRSRATSSWPGQDEQAVSHLVLAAQDARSVAAMAEAAAFLTEAAAIEPA